MLQELRNNDCDINYTTLHCAARLALQVDICYYFFVIHSVQSLTGISTATFQQLLDSSIQRLAIRFKILWRCLRFLGAELS